MSSHGASMLDETGVFCVFAAFALNATRADGEGSSTETASNGFEELLADYENAVLCDTYVTDGLAAETDLFVRVHARGLTTAQAFVREFRERVLGAARNEPRRSSVSSGTRSTRRRPPISTRN
ncbi:hypothetical protein BRD01_04285 [Halobacteriales archaeon QS_8_65_32]|nr:MAG: hypothetical protein BRD01_04285 [Halobacteriales archaeon QS_8_65_32]